MGAETQEQKDERMSWELFPDIQQHQPTFVSVDQEVLIRALSAAEEAKEFAAELLAIHDTNLGRTLKRHRMRAEELEKSMEKASKVQVELRTALGWPQR